MQPDEQEYEPPIWAVFGDLMACLFGLFVLFFVWTVMGQVVLDRDLTRERASLAAAHTRLSALESALAGPLASGLITLVDGRIGIRGALLFETNDAGLRREGKRLLEQLAPPLYAFLGQHDLVLMVSGYTDGQPLKGNGEYEDNWELSAQRALTVTRALARAGIPAGSLIAAGLGEHHPIASNDSEESRAKNRRVEIAPVPKPKSFSVRPRANAAPAPDTAP
jgi:flagellar motor protein MotB